MAQEKKFCVRTASFTSFQFSLFRLSIMHVCHLLGPPRPPRTRLSIIWFIMVLLGESFDFSLWLFYDSLSTVFGSHTKLLTHCETEGREFPSPHRMSFFSRFPSFLPASCLQLIWMANTNCECPGKCIQNVLCLCTCQYFFEFPFRSIANCFSIQWLVLAVTTLLGEWNNFILK